MKKAKYQLLYETIKEDIQKGKYKTNLKLPSEYELVKLYDTSRDTIRKTLNLLEQNGLINKVKGKGSFVLDLKNQYNFPISGLTSFTEISNSLKEKPKTNVVEFYEFVSDEYFLNNMNLEKSENLVCAKRQRVMNGEKVILDIDVLRKKFVSDFTIDIAKKSIFNYLEKEKLYKIGFAKKEISVKKANEDDYKYLDMLNFDLVVVVDTLIYLDDGILIQYTSSHHRPDKFKFVDFAKRNM